MAYHTTTLKVNTYSLIRLGLRLAYKYYSGNVLEIVAQRSSHSTLITCAYVKMGDHRYITSYRPLYIVPRVTRGYSAFNLWDDHFWFGTRKIVDHILSMRR